MNVRPVLCASVLALGCRSARPDPAPALAQADAAVAAPPASTVVSAAAAPASEAGVTTTADAGSASAVSLAPSGWGRGRADGGAGCRVLRGPIELPMRVPAALSLREDAVDAILNEDGKPRVVALAAGPVQLSLVPAGREPLQGERGAGLGVPCATAGERIFCPDRSGQVHRSTRGETDDHVVASSRPSSRVSAAMLGPAHVALGYLASRQTTEGWMSEAWIAVDDDAPVRASDDDAPVRASDDGSGATSLALAPRGVGLLALMVDARTALTAMHARPVTYDRRVRFGEDAVVFVGGPGDRRTRAALAVPDGAVAWSLLPIAKDVGSFGLAVVRIDDPPRVDEPSTWAMYPNGLDPAPVAAVWAGGHAPATWVALVRPQEATPGSPRVLEIGELAATGEVAVDDAIPTSGSPSDVSLAADAFGALWLAWVDTAGSWLERLHCAAGPAARPALHHDH